MPVRAFDPSSSVLYRIGRAPNPLAWPPPRAAAGNNRFDDPQNEFRVLYAGTTRRVCFVETLAGARPSLEFLAKLRQVRPGPRGDDRPPVGRLPDDYLKRLIGSFTLAPGQRWLDFRSLETHQALVEEMAEGFLTLGYDQFDASHALSSDRRLTQAIARWSFDEGFHGIVYPSRLEPSLDCWAIFDRAVLIPETVSAINRDDPDLIGVARIYRLTIP